MKMRTCLIVLALLLGAAAHGASQSLNAAFQRSTVLMTFDASLGRTVRATGVLIFRPTTGDQGQLLLVTTRDSVPVDGNGAKSLRLRVVVGPVDQPVVRLLEIPVCGKDGRYLPTVFLHPTPSVDLVAVNVTEAIVRDGIANSWLHADLLATPKRIKDEGIAPGDGVFVLGYPDYLTDTRNASPVLRNGLVSTPPLEGFAVSTAMKDRGVLGDRLDAYLVDVDAFAAAPGHLVILRPQAVAPTQGSAAPPKAVPYILGLVSGPVDPGEGSTARAGLAIVSSAQAIRSLIDGVPR